MAKGDRHFELVTGCSRTADIEKVLTLGVHGPKSYHLWICD
jgi:L-lactate dehydrogenase complex protein LldG